MPADAKFKPHKEISRLKSRIRQLEKEKTKTLPDLGGAAYGLFLEGKLDVPPLSDTCTRLQAIDAEVKMNQEEVERLRALAAAPPAPQAPPGLSCPQCGAALNPGDRFCGVCGRDIAPSAAPPAPAPPGPTAMDNCPSCGASSPSGVRFCPECGSRVQPEGMAETPGVAGAAPPPPAQPAPPAEPSPGPGVSGAGETGPPSGKPWAPVSPDAEARSCTRCGAAVEEGDAAFCGECGARL